MINFYPGPSKLHPEIENYFRDAFHSGLLSMNHRSTAFMEMLSDTITALKEKLGIPPSYEVIMVSSATECWEIIAQSLTRGKSFHLYNGAFGRKWQEYANRIHGRSTGISFRLNELPVLKSGPGEADDVLCLTHTETSNGTVIPDQSLSLMREEFSGLIAVDATSSMAGVSLPWESGDVWFASVQKCFGMPSGMGVMVLSPRGCSESRKINEHNFYNSLEFALDNFRKFQTPYTPNILGIYLLGRLMKQLDPVVTTAGKLIERSRKCYQIMEAIGFRPLVQESACRSATVVVLEGKPDQVKNLKAYANEAGIILGSGYGEWKENTFRIANFPAHTDGDFDSLNIFFTNTHKQLIQ